MVFQFTEEYCSVAENISNQNMRKQISRHSNLLGMLPYNVKELLEAQLQQEAINESNTKAHRADAAYEYANMVFRSAGLNLSTSRVVNALDLLAQSANNGHLEAQSTVGLLHDALGYSLPVRREVEIEWLFAGSLRGSMTAQTRLKKLDPEKYEEAIVLIGSLYGGLSPEMSRLLHDQNLLDVLSDDASRFPVGYIHYLASIGDLELLIKSSRLPKEMYNLRNILGETPLLVACRAGHAKVATFLLQRGSDPSISTNQGVCPLHFLSAFDNQSIPTMATLLLQYGAVLEQPSRNALLYKEQFDSRFGSVNGTPLLWAVAARNTSATEALVERGADPFKTTTEPVRAIDEDDWWEPSPIQWAALWHQHQLLKILLSGAKIPQERIALQQRLNTTFFRCYDSYHSALYAALDCNPTFRFHELLLHGKTYECAALKCVRLLVKYGADPKILSRDWNNQSDDPIVAACHGGSILLIKYLWQYKNGSLRPTPKRWLDCVQGAIFSHNRSVFDFLFEHREDIASDYAADKAAVKKILLITEDQYFALASLKLVLKPTCAHRSTELVELFETAVWAGHFEAAKHLFQEGGLSLASRIDVNTFLGNLISMSSTHPNVERKISFLLSVLPRTDELFWNVSYLAGSGLTALEAIVCAQNHGSCMNARVFNAILEYFNDPKYLNSQVKGKPCWKYTGYSALHLAVEYNNPDAVLILLSKTGIDPNLLNSRGESPTDLCIVRDQTLAERLDREFPACTPSIHKEKETNIMVLYNLLSAGGRISKFCAVIRRSSENNFDIIHRMSGHITSVHLYGKFCFESQYQGMLTSTQIRSRLPAWQYLDPRAP
jgi:ankyrin repeat protein